jgi:hypothetical protein
MQPANFADRGVPNVEFPEATFCSKKFRSARPLEEGPVLLRSRDVDETRAFLISSAAVRSDRIGEDTELHDLPRRVRLPMPDPVVRGEESGKTVARNPLQAGNEITRLETALGEVFGQYVDGNTLGR